MSKSLAKSFSKLSSKNNFSLIQTPSEVHYMLGRFQPFTMGHLALFNNMVLESSKSPKGVAYLFVSYKISNFSRKRVHELEEILDGKNPSVKMVKPLMKQDKSIMDNPLTTRVRFQIIDMLMRTIYGNDYSRELRGENVFIIDKILDVDSLFASGGNKKSSIKALENPVEVHLVDSKIMDTGGFKAHSFLKNKYGKSTKAKMMTGTNRDGRLPAFIMQNNPIFLKRNEANTSDAFHPTGLSGSKIRSWSVIYYKTKNELMLENIRKSYYGILSNNKLVKYIINPISESIFDGEMVKELNSLSNSLENNRNNSNNTNTNSVSVRKKQKTKKLFKKKVIKKKQKKPKTFKKSKLQSKKKALKINN